MINIYFYRVRNRTNVIESWKGCVGVPAVDDRVLLGDARVNGIVREVTWSKPEPYGPQVVDVYVDLVATRASAIGVQYGDHNVQSNVFNAVA